MKGKMKNRKKVEKRNNIKILFLSTSNGKEMTCHEPTFTYTTQNTHMHCYACLPTFVLCWPPFFLMFSLFFCTFRPRVLRALVRDTQSHTQSASDVAAEPGTNRISVALLAGILMLVSVNVNKKIIYMHYFFSLSIVHTSIQLHFL